MKPGVIFYLQFLDALFKLGPKNIGLVQLGGFDIRRLDVIVDGYILTSLAAPVI